MNAKTQPILSAEGLTVGYAARRAAPTVVAEALDVCLQPGELVCLLGPNGAGKSTLIRTLVGMQPALAGHVHVRGRDIRQMTARQLAQCMSVVLTERLAPGAMTVYTVVALGRYPHTDWLGKLTDADRNAVHTALDTAGAAELANRFLSELSDGERQKVMIARALAQETKVMVLDEPTAFLDLPRRVELMRLLRQLAHETGKAILCSTHDLDLALRCADRVWLMAKSEPFRSGAPEDLVLEGAFGKAFQADGVAFDPGTGSFRVHTPHGAKVHIRGTGAPAFWTQRALERAGYDIVPTGSGESSGRVSLETTEDGRCRWRWEFGDQQQTLASLAELVAAARACAVRAGRENKLLDDTPQDPLRVERSPASARTRRAARARALMFQGTSSNAGKSVLTAALCRILLQDGVRVAPFKAQNMSLNSFVTRDGGEMGRAQVVQAQACRLDPDVRMNPILLKPSSGTGSQVILRGQPLGNMQPRQYGDYNREAFAAVTECYDSLASEFDVIVLEGAGSPGEVNLKQRDIVNMRMARHAEAPVLLVGDIDRGGVYAAFVGTMAVLDEWERALVAGFVVNRFRGDAALLEPAHDYMLSHTGRPVLGVVPFLTDLNLPEEDSVEFKNHAFDPVGAPAADQVHVAVVDLPHISNFTDLDALRLEPDVHLSIARSPGDLRGADAVILPGSKNVIADLMELREHGLVDALLALHAKGQAEVVGICGGYQMLGERIRDPHGVESDAGTVPGLSLLPVTTELAADKTLTRAVGTHCESGCGVRGYEIHHGQTGGTEHGPLLQLIDGGEDGCVSADGRVWGTYLHGIFDADEFRRWFIDRLRVRRGLPPHGKVQICYDIEPALDRVAQVVRASLDMERVYRLLGL